MEQSTVTIRLDRKDAKKLCEAMSKGTWDKLTPKQADVLESFIVDLQIEVGA